MATDKRQFELDLLARNKMGPATRAAAADLDKVGKAADAAADSAEDLGKASAIAGEGAEKLGKESQQAAKDVNQLNDEIKLVERELVGLATAFTAAGSAAERLDISKAIRSSQAELRRLKTSKGILEGILPDPAPIAKSFMQRLGAGLASGGTSLASAVGSAPGAAIGAAIGAAAAPVVLSAMGSAISAGAGLGVIGAGIAAAVAKDPETRRAGAAVAKSFIDGFQESAVRNFKGPIQQSLGILAAEGDRIAKSWDAAFASLADSIVPLTSDVVHGVDRINESIVNAAKNSEPALAGMGDAWILLADGAGDALDTLSDGSKAAAGNLVLLSGATADLMKISANTLGVLAELSNSPWVTGPLLPALKQHYTDAANESKTFAEATAVVTGALTAQQRAAAGSMDALADLNTELKAQADPVFALREAQIKLSEAQAASAKAVKKHGENSKEARAATRDLAKAALEMQGAAGKLGDEFTGELTPAMRATMKAAGATDDQINAVENEFKEAKKAGNAFAKTYASNVKVNGVPAAKKMLFTVKEIIDGIPKAIRISMRITGVTNVSAAAAAVRKNTRAKGGPVNPGEPYWVGEEGPELIMPMAAGRVLTAQKSRQLMRPGPWGANRHIAGARAVGAAFNSSLVSTAQAVPVIKVDVTGAEGKFKAWIRELYRTGQLP